VSGRRTVLVVEDDPGTLYVLANGLSSVLDMFDVVTAENGREAIDLLEERQIDALVTDLAMPVMDGFSLIAHLTTQRATIPVIVLSGMAPDRMDQRLAGYGGLRVLRKPIGYQELAQCVLEEIERVDLGQVEGIPLASVLQLIEAERRSCSVVVTSGKRRGRLQFESGRLVNAFSDDFGAEGEAAAYDILSWTNAAIGFEQLPNDVRKLVRTPMQLMLIELAVVQDGLRPGGTRVQDVPVGEPPPTEPVTAAGVGGQAIGSSIEAAAGEGADHVPSVHDAGDFHLTSLSAPDATTSLPGPLMDGGHAVAIGTIAATAHAAPGNGEAMRPDSPDDEILQFDPGPTQSEHAQPTAQPTAQPATAPTAEPTAEPTAQPATAPTEETTTEPTEQPGAPDDHVAAMVAAVERLARRARAADEALAAVAAEVDAFRSAQRRFDEVEARRELRRRKLEAFRDDVARLAREILGRADGLFDTMAGSDAPTDPYVQTPA
jgi:CheY-like chemotaxis protein